MKNAIQQLQKCCTQHHQYNKTSDAYDAFMSSLEEAYTAISHPSFKENFQSMMNGALISHIPRTAEYLQWKIISTYAISENPINIDITGLESEMLLSLMQNINEDQYFTNNTLLVRFLLVPLHDDKEGMVLSVQNIDSTKMNADDVATNFTTSLLLNILTQKYLAEKTAGQYWKSEKEKPVNTNMNDVQPPEILVSQGTMVS